MLNFTHHRRPRIGILGALRGKVLIDAWGPAAFNAGVPIVATPPGAAPGTISTQPTVTVVQTAPPLPVAPPAAGAPVMFPPTADVPSMTVLPPARRAWLPWAIGGGILAALGAAAAVTLANR